MVGCPWGDREDHPSPKTFVLTRSPGKEAIVVPGVLGSHADVVLGVLGRLGPPLLLPVNLRARRVWS